MSANLGDKIRQLRKGKGISQEVLAQYLGVSFQAVSKWETGTTLPDVTLIPAIASFFGVSTDELFDYNRLEAERRERILREGLKKYPGNDVILNNLLYTMAAPERGEEMVTICKTLIEGTHDDEVKYDALRILAQTYHDMGQQDLVAPTLEQIPELYFTKLECMALLLEGEAAFKAARQHMGLCLEQLVEMLLVMERQAQGEGADQYRRLAQQVLELFERELRPGGELVREIREELLGGAQT